MTSSRYATALEVLADLPATLRATRTTAGVSIRDAAHQIGIGKATLERLESGNVDYVALATVVKAIAFIEAHNPDEGATVRTSK
jgi:predicted transcriptional regulator